MKTGQLFWGVFFLLAGTLFLIDNITGIQMNWLTILKFWPLVLVVWGASFFLKKSSFKWIFTSLSAIILAIVLFASIKSTYNFFDSIFHHRDSYEYRSETYSLPYSDEIKKAYFNLDAEVGEFEIENATDNLFLAKTGGSFGKYIFNHFQDNGAKKIMLELNERDFSFEDMRNQVEVSLNSNPVWNLEFDINAAKIDLNLKPFKINSLKISSAAAAIDLDFGDLSDLTYVTLDAAASSIIIDLPENIGCELKAETELSSKTLPGLKSVGKNLYRSENFEDKEKKIFIDIESSLSSIKLDYK